ncbi:MAG: hypothetical protein ACRCWO_06085, partial [Bosea sp. (in: a-proteobacteria)]
MNPGQLGSLLQSKSLIGLQDARNKLNKFVSTAHAFIDQTEKHPFRTVDRANAAASAPFQAMPAWPKGTSGAVKVNAFDKATLERLIAEPVRGADGAILHPGVMSYLQVALPGKTTSKLELPAGSTTYSTLGAFGLIPFSSQTPSAKQIAAALVGLRELAANKQSENADDAKVLWKSLPQQLRDVALIINQSRQDGLPSRGAASLGDTVQQPSVSQYQALLGDQLVFRGTQADGYMAALGEVRISSSSTDSRRRVTKTMEERSFYDLKNLGADTQSESVSVAAKRQQAVAAVYFADKIVSKISPETAASQGLVFVIPPSSTPGRVPGMQMVLDVLQKRGFKTEDVLVNPFKRESSAKGGGRDAERQFDNVFVKKALTNNVDFNGTSVAKTYVVLDDILTSGATLAASVQILTQNGAQNVIPLALVAATHDGALNSVIDMRFRQLSEMLPTSTAGGFQNLTASRQELVEWQESWNELLDYALSLRSVASKPAPETVTADIVSSSRVGEFEPGVPVEFIDSEGVKRVGRVVETKIATGYVGVMPVDSGNDPRKMNLTKRVDFSVGPNGSGTLRLAGDSYAASLREGLGQSPNRSGTALQEIAAALNINGEVNSQSIGTAGYAFADKRSQNRLAQAVLKSELALRNPDIGVADAVSYLLEQREALTAFAIGASKSIETQQQQAARLNALYNAAIAEILGVGSAENDTDPTDGGSPGAPTPRTNSNIPDIQAAATTTIASQANPELAKIISQLQNGGFTSTGPASITSQTTAADITSQSPDLDIVMSANGPRNDGSQEDANADNQNTNGQNGDTQPAEEISRQNDSNAISNRDGLPSLADYVAANEASFPPPFFNSATPRPTAEEWAEWDAAHQGAPLPPDARGLISQIKSGELANTLENWDQVRQAIVTNPASSVPQPLSGAIRAGGAVSDGVAGLYQGARGLVTGAAERATAPVKAAVGAIDEHGVGRLPEDAAGAVRQGTQIAAAAANVVLDPGGSVTKVAQKLFELREPAVNAAGKAIGWGARQGVRALDATNRALTTNPLTATPYGALTAAAGFAGHQGQRLAGWATERGQAVGGALGAGASQLQQRVANSPFGQSVTAIATSPQAREAATRLAAAGQLGVRGAMSAIDGFMTVGTDVANIANRAAGIAGGLALVDMALFGGPVIIHDSSFLRDQLNAKATSENVLVTAPHIPWGLGVAWDNSGGIFRATYMPGDDVRGASLPRLDLQSAKDGTPVRGRAIGTASLRNGILPFLPTEFTAGVVAGGSEINATNYVTVSQAAVSGNPLALNLFNTDASPKNNDLSARIAAFTTPLSINMVNRAGVGPIGISNPRWVGSQPALVAAIGDPAVAGKGTALLTSTPLTLNVGGAYLNEAKPAATLNSGSKLLQPGATAEDWNVGNWLADAVKPIAREVYVPTAQIPEGLGSAITLTPAAAANGAQGYDVTVKAPDGKDVTLRFDTNRRFDKTTDLAAGMPLRNAIETALGLPLSAAEQVQITEPAKNESYSSRQVTLDIGPALKPRDRSDFDPLAGRRLSSDAAAGSSPQMPDDREGPAGATGRRAPDIGPAPDGTSAQLGSTTQPAQGQSTQAQPVQSAQDSAQDVAQLEAIKQQLRDGTLGDGTLDPGITSTGPAPITSRSDAGSPDSTGPAPILSQRADLDITLSASRPRNAESGAFTQAGALLAENGLPARLELASRAPASGLMVDAAPFLHGLIVEVINADGLVEARQIRLDSEWGHGMPADNMVDLVSADGWDVATQTLAELRSANPQLILLGKSVNLAGNDISYQIIGIDTASGTVSLKAYFRDANDPMSRQTVALSAVLQDNDQLSALLRGADLDAAAAVNDRAAAPLSGLQRADHAGLTRAGFREQNGQYIKDGAVLASNGEFFGKVDQTRNGEPAVWISSPSGMISGYGASSRNDARGRPQTPPAPTVQLQGLGFQEKQPGIWIGSTTADIYMVVLNGGAIETVTRRVVRPENQGPLRAEVESGYTLEADVLGRDGRVIGEIAYAADGAVAAAVYPALPAATDIGIPARQEKEIAPGVSEWAQSNPSSQAILAIEQINGVAISQIEQDMQPDVRYSKGGVTSSDAGFLARGDKLLEVWAQQNDHVTSLGRTHAELATVLDTIKQIGNDSVRGAYVAINTGTEVFHIRRSTLNTFALQSPFRDDFGVQDTYVDRFTLNAETGEFVHQGEYIIPDLGPGLVAKGFYESGSRSLGPQSLVDFFAPLLGPANTDPGGAPNRPDTNAPGTNTPGIDGQKGSANGQSAQLAAITQALKDGTLGNGIAAPQITSTGPAAITSRSDAGSLDSTGPAPILSQRADLDIQMSASSQDRAGGQPDTSFTHPMRDDDGNIVNVTLPFDAAQFNDRTRTVAFELATGLDRYFYGMPDAVGTVREAVLAQVVNVSAQGETPTMPEFVYGLHFHELHPLMGDSNGVGEGGYYANFTNQLEFGPLLDLVSETGIDHIQDHGPILAALPYEVMSERYQASEISALFERAKSGLVTGKTGDETHNLALNGLLVSAGQMENGAARDALVAEYTSTFMAIGAARFSPQAVYSDFLMTAALDMELGITSLVADMLNEVDTLETKQEAIERDMPSREILSGRMAEIASQLPYETFLEAYQAQVWPRLSVELQNAIQQMPGDDTPRGGSPAPGNGPSGPTLGTQVGQTAANAETSASRFTYTLTTTTGASATVTLPFNLDNFYSFTTTDAYEQLSTFDRYYQGVPDGQLGTLRDAMTAQLVLVTDGEEGRFVPPDFTVDDASEVRLFYPIHDIHPLVGNPNSSAGENSLIARYLDELRDNTFEDFATRYGIDMIAEINPIFEALWADSSYIETAIDDAVSGNGWLEKYPDHNQTLEGIRQQAINSADPAQIADLKTNYYNEARAQMANAVSPQRMYEDYLTVMALDWLLGLTPTQYKLSMEMMNQREYDAFLDQSMPSRAQLAEEIEEARQQLPYADFLAAYDRYLRPQFSPSFQALFDNAATPSSPGPDLSALPGPFREAGPFVDAVRDPQGIFSDILEANFPSVSNATSQQPRATVSREFRDSFLSRHPSFFNDVRLGISAVQAVHNNADWRSDSGARHDLMSRDGVPFAVTFLAGGSEGDAFRFDYPGENGTTSLVVKIKHGDYDISTDPVQRMLATEALRQNPLIQQNAEKIDIVPIWLALTGVRNEYDANEISVMPYVENTSGDSLERRFDKIHGKETSRTHLDALVDLVANALDEQADIIALPAGERLKLDTQGLNILVSDTPEGTKLSLIDAIHNERRVPTLADAKSARESNAGSMWGLPGLPPVDNAQASGLSATDAARSFKDATALYNELKASYAGLTANPVTPSVRNEQFMLDAVLSEQAQQRDVAVLLADSNNFSTYNQMTSDAQGDAAIELTSQAVNRVADRLNRMYAYEGMRFVGIRKAGDEMALIGMFDPAVAGDQRHMPDSVASDMARLFHEELVSFNAQMAMPIPLGTSSAAVLHPGEYNNPQQLGALLDALDHVGVEMFNKGKIEDGDVVNGGTRWSKNAGAVVLSNGTTQIMLGKTYQIDPSRHELIEFRMAQGGLIDSDAAYANHDPNVAFTDTNIDPFTGEIYGTEFARPRLDAGQVQAAINASPSLPANGMIFQVSGIDAETIQALADPDSAVWSDPVASQRATDTLLDAINVLRAGTPLESTMRDLQDDGIAVYSQPVALGIEGEGQGLGRIDALIARAREAGGSIRLEYIEPRGLKEVNDAGYVLVNGQKV